MPEAGDLTLISGHDCEAIKRAKRGWLHPQKEYAAGERQETAGRQGSCLVMREGAVEGRLDNWGEVVTR